MEGERSSTSGERIPDHEVHSFMLDFLARHEKEIFRRHHEEEEEQRQSAASERLIQSTRFRLAGFRNNGTSHDRLANDLELLRNIERPLAQWVEDAKNEVKRACPEDRDPQGMTPLLRALAQKFHTEGGHTSSYTFEQREFIAEHGIILFIELRVREDLFLTVGAVTGLSANPCSDPDVGTLHRLFPQFDLADLAITDPDDKAGLQDDARQSFLTCRSSILPNTDHEEIQRQLRLKGKTMPRDFQNLDLRRHGLPSRAKAIAFLIAEKFGSKYAMSNIASVKWGQGLGALANLPSTGFNRWMTELASRKSFREVIDEASRMRLSLKAYLAHLHLGIEAQIGKDGIATRKGHDIQSIREDAEKKYLSLCSAIQQGRHAPWGDVSVSD